MTKSLADAWTEGYMSGNVDTTRAFAESYSNGTLQYERETNPYLDPRRTQLEAARQAVIDVAKEHYASASKSFGVHANYSAIGFVVRQLLDLESDTP